MIPERDQEVLQDLAEAAAHAKVSFFIVGAGARLLTHDWPRGIAGGRTTTDWDIAIRVGSWSEFERFKAALLAHKRGAVFMAGRAPHQILHRSAGVPVDVIPFGLLEMPTGAITWPQGGPTMSVTVFSACESMCRSIGLASGLAVAAATVPALVLMKAHAHVDRFAAGESRDLRDIDFLLRTYAGEQDDERVFDLGGDFIRSGKLLIEDAGAFLLGVDTALKTPDALLTPLLDLIGQTADPFGAVISALVSRIWDEEEDLARREAIRRRFAALGLGLDNGVQRQRGVDSEE
ncbi:MAG: hypothetical protein GF400_10980 [Candidatus Eisenbacteria bacterium]|nr:hypothetical protein [Candidatus Eisenbacteria bacterium]